MPASATVAIAGRPHMVDATALEMARRAYAMRAQNRRLGFARIARVLQSEGFDCQGRNTARRAACLGAWAAGARDTAAVLAALNVAVDASLELVHRGDAGARVVRRRTTTAARATGAAVTPRPRGMAAAVGTFRRAAVNLRNAVGSARTVGVEVEYHGNRTNVGPVAIGACERNPAVLIDAASVGDGSVRSGAEIRGPVVRNTPGGWNVYRDMIAAMRSERATVCAGDGRGICGGPCTAGIHVHVGADDLTMGMVAAVCEFYARHISAIDTLVPASRRSTSGHSYCHGATVQRVAEYARDMVRQYGADANAVNTLRGRVTITRYAAVNMQALAAHSTLEFRQHGASLNSRKIRAWARFVTAIVDHAAAGTLPALSWCATIGEVAHALMGADDADARYLSGRRA